MTNPGLHIEVSKDEFLRKPDKEQHWMLFEAIQRINGHGCRYGHTRWKKLFAWATGAGLIGGFIGGIAKRLW
jgi:hypothetical protein